MKESLKRYQQRCRCCLEKLTDNENTSVISNFFQMQFQSFCGFELKENNLLSRQVCEFCHQELLRFSVFKKDLIEKQQRLNELLRHHEEKSSKPNKSKISKNGTIEISSSSEYSSDASETEEEEEELQTEQEVLENEEDEEDEEEEKLSSLVESDDDRDNDFLVLNGKPVLKPPKSTKKNDQTSPYLTCDYCMTTFKAKQGLTRHVQSHVGRPTPWKCTRKNCKYAGSSKIKLRKHRLEVHKIPIPLSKSELKKIFEKPKQKPEKKMLPQKHKTINRPEHKCTFGCENTRYVKKGHLLRHIRTIHPDKLEKYQRSVVELNCDECSFKTTGKAEMKKHKEKHHKGSKFECDKCHKMFLGVKSLKAHKRNFHDFNCETCELKFADKTKFKEHFSECRQDLKKFKCKICKKGFEKLSLVHKHHLVSHKYDPRSRFKSTHKSFKCPTPDCTRSFVKRYDLRKHQKDAGHLLPEELEKMYICVCDQRFYSASGFSYHRDKHNC